MSVYLRAALLGLATGGRSTLGLTALACTASRPGPVALRWVAGLGSAVELAGDKVPQAPSRLAPVGLAARLAGAAASGGWLARRAGERGSAVPLAGLIAMAAALAGALLGHRWRSLGARRLGTDLPGALAEDVLWLAVAGYPVAGLGHA